MGGFACSFMKETLYKVNNAKIKTWPNPLKGSGNTLQSGTRKQQMGEPSCSKGTPRTMPPRQVIPQNTDLDSWFDSEKLI